MNLILWLLSLAALISAYLIVPNTGMLCVIVLFIIAPIVSWIILLLIRKKIEIELFAPGVVEKRKSFDLQAKLFSHIRLPIGKTVMWLELTNTATGETQKKRVYFQGNGQWNLQSAYCGCVECFAVSVWSYDIFGILPVRIPCKAKKRIVVMPDTFPVEVESILSYSDLDDCTEYAPDKKGNDRSETLQIREYVPGDSIQQIHWKLSSKLDKLIVRDPSEPADHEMMVFLDHSGRMPKPAEADAMMEAVVSVCQGLTEAGQPFRLAWNAETICVYEVNNKEQLPEAVAALLKSRHSEDFVSVAELFQKTRGNEKVGAVLYFCFQLPQDQFPAQRMQVYLCGHDENVVAFTSEDVSDVLRKICWS